MTLTCKKNKNKPTRLITGNDTCVEKSKNKNTSGTYRGHLKKGKFDGKGRFTWKDRSTYLGQWKKGKFDGKGEFKDSINGAIKSGIWKKHKFDGPGKWTYYKNNKKSKKNKRVISGHWNGNGVVNGKCAKEYSLVKYVGDCKNNVGNGKGTLTYKSGKVGKGDIKDNDLTGKCVIKYKDGGVYKGTCKKGQPQGKGKFTYKDGQINTGTYSNNNLNGKCVKEFPSYTYKGNCKDGYASGRGTQKHKNGKVETGIWKNGKLV